MLQPVAKARISKHIAIDFTLSSFPCAYEDEICFQSVPYSDLFDFCGL